jgi:hypothetical protein
MHVYGVASLVRVRSDVAESSGRSGRITLKSLALWDEKRPLPV